MSMSLEDFRIFGTHHSEPALLKSPAMLSLVLSGRFATCFEIDYSSCLKVSTEKQMGTATGNFLGELDELDPG